MFLQTSLLQRVSFNKKLNIDKQKTKIRALNAPPSPRDTVRLPLEGTIMPSPFQPLPAVESRNTRQLTFMPL